MATTFYSCGHFTLVLQRVAGNTTWQDFALFIYKLQQKVGILIINVLDSETTEAAIFLRCCPIFGLLRNFISSLDAIVSFFELTNNWNLIFFYFINSILYLRSLRSCCFNNRSCYRSGGFNLRGFSNRFFRRSSLFLFCFFGAAGLLSRSLSLSLSSDLDSFFLTSTFPIKPLRLSSLYLTPNLSSAAVRKRIILFVTT